MSKSKNADDPDREVLDWVVILHNDSRGFVTQVEHLTYESGQSILNAVQYGKGLRFSHLQRTYRPGYIDWAEIMPQVDWDNLGQQVERP